MKKTLSFLLALTLLFALCVSAFAEGAAESSGRKTIEGRGADLPGEKSDTAIVRTKKEDDSGQTGASYRVWIPAVTEIEWNAAETPVPYAVESHLEYGQRLHVRVEVTHPVGSAHAGRLIYKPAANPADEQSLPYTIDGTVFDADREVYYDERQTDPAGAVYISGLTVKIKPVDWNKAIVGAYEDTLTFTAWVEPSATA